MANEIRRRFETGVYDEIDSLQIFANRLTGTLDVIDDWHLWVNYYAEPIREDYVYRRLSIPEPAATGSTTVSSWIMSYRPTSRGGSTK